MLDELMPLLSVPDRLRMGGVPNRRLNEAVDDQLRAARLLHSAPDLHTLGGFLRALHGAGESAEAAVAQLPRRLQREPLVALGARIAALPATQQDFAAAAWSGFPFHGSPDDLLDDLRLAAARGADGIQRREQRLVGEWGEAFVEVMRGEQVHRAARALGISGPASIERLELVAVRAIGENLSEYHHLPALLAHAGLSSPAASEQLQLIAASRVGAAAIRRGRTMADLVDVMGITSPQALDVLRVEAARHDVARGVPVPQAASQHGVEDRLGELEVHAGLTEGRRQALAGEPAARIAQRLGLQDAGVLAQLEIDAAHGAASPPTERLVHAAIAAQGGAAFEAIMAGVPVQDVARAHGMTDAVGIGLLEHLAMGQIWNTFQARDHLPSRLAEAGVTSPHHVEQLEQWVAAGPGTTAIQHGWDSSVVAARLGITTAAALHVLDLSAAEGDISLGVPADVVFGRRRISDPEERRGLESWALASTGQRRLDQGEPVPQVAQRLGLREPEVIRSLHLQAATTVGRAAVDAGEEPEDVARRLGIDHPPALQALELAAAERDVGTGMTAREAIARRHIEDPGHRLLLETQAVTARGLVELQVGDGFQAAVDRLGIEHPDAVRLLRMLNMLNEAPPFVRGRMGW